VFFIPFPHLNFSLYQYHNIEFGYDAVGVKLWKKVIENSVVKSKTDYLGEFPLAQVLAQRNLC
jgi:hypothetical protein